MRTERSLSTPAKRWLQAFVQSGCEGETIELRDAPRFALLAKRYRDRLRKRWYELTWQEKLIACCQIRQSGPEVMVYFPLDGRYPTPSDLVAEVDRRMSRDAE